MINLNLILKVYPQLMQIRYCSPLYGDVAAAPSTSSLKDRCEVAAIGSVTNEHVLSLLQLGSQCHACVSGYVWSYLPHYHSTNQPQN